jgi:hypothetical protein
MAVRTRIEEPLRRAIARLLVERGYTLVEQASDTSDPFAWELRAEKDGYAVRIREQSKDLIDG